MLRCDNKNTPTPPQAINNDRSLKWVGLIIISFNGNSVSDRML